MGAKTVLFTSVPNKDSQAYTETVLEPHTASLLTSNVYPLQHSYALLYRFDLCLLFGNQSWEQGENLLIATGKIKNSMAIVDKNV